MSSNTNNIAMISPYPNMASYQDPYEMSKILQLSTNKVELIWQMGVTSLNQTDNEIRIPAALSDNLGRKDIIELESRLSDHLGGAPVVSFKDLSMNVYRILRMPDMRLASTSPTPSVSPGPPTSSASSPSNISTMSTPKSRQYGKKSKIPRPPNAFILYRQKHHPIVKSQNPDLHNNDISVILGQQWKNEDPDVRDKFKALAEELKHQHFIRFPDYQYAPRKPSEKKRRMTARKLAKMQNFERGQDTSDFPTYESSISRPDSIGASMTAQEAGMQSRLQNVPSVGDILGFEDQGNAHSGTFSSNQEIIEELDSIFPDPLLSPTVPVNNIAFLNSVVDWNAVNSSIDLAQPAVQANGNDLALDQEENQAADEAFWDEIKRVVDWFE